MQALRFVVFSGVGYVLGDFLLSPYFERDKQAMTFHHVLRHTKHGGPLADLIRKCMSERRDHYVDYWKVTTNDPYGRYDLEMYGEACPDCGLLEKHGIPRIYSPTTTEERPERTRQGIPVWLPKQVEENARWAIHTDTAAKFWM